jgi:hypothetical protein
VRLGYSFFSGYQRPVRIVVTDRNSLDAAWIEVNHNMMPIPATPDVDFNQDIVVVAALGPRTSGGERITIDSARAAGQDVDVYVSSRSPAAGCVTTTVMTSPADIVSLSQPAGSVQFIEQALQVGC